MYTMIKEDCSDYKGHEMVFWFIMGIWLWTLFEYLAHRFFFHGEEGWMQLIPFNKYLYMFHFCIHGIHHSFPQDRMRLAFPPTAGHAIGFPIYWLCEKLLPVGIGHLVFLGFMVGYQLYDEIHYWSHHSSCNVPYFRDVKEYHMKHHYKYGKIGFGVSSKFWDIVVGTEI